MSLKRISILFSGKVQGVGFRFHARDYAEQHNLTGWVSNNPNRNVACEVQGEAIDVDVFCDEMHDGPPLARVTGMKIVELPIGHNETSFDVLF
jgi:acylphosphatase